MEPARRAPVATAAVRSKRQCVRSFGTHTTLDVFDERVSDTETEVNTVSSKADSEGSVRCAVDVEEGLADLEDPCDDEELRDLAELGFSDLIADEQLLSAPDSSQPVVTKRTWPPKMKNLFWRQFCHAHCPEGLTERRVQESKAACQTPLLSVKTSAPANCGDWLVDFKALAKAAPMVEVTATAIGKDLGIRVADFVGDDVLEGLSEHSAATLDEVEPNGGGRVVGAIRHREKSFILGGRKGFVIADDVSVSTPSRSSARGSSFGSDGVNEDVNGEDWPGGRDRPRTIKALAQRDWRPFDGSL